MNFGIVAAELGLAYGGEIGVHVLSFLSCYSFLSICMLRERLMGDVYNGECRRRQTVVLLLD